MDKGEKISHFRELHVYKRAFAAAMRIFELTKSFPVEERYSLVDQIRRSSRSVCSNLAEGWRKRKYEAVFKNKMTMPCKKLRKRSVGWSFLWLAVTSTR